MSRKAVRETTVAVDGFDEPATVEAEKVFLKALAEIYAKLWLDGGLEGLRAAQDDAAE